MTIPHLLTSASRLTTNGKDADEQALNLDVLSVIPGIHKQAWSSFNTIQQISNRRHLRYVRHLQNYSFTEKV